MGTKLAVREKPVDDALRTFDLVVKKNYLSSIDDYPSVGREIDVNRELEFVRLDTVTKIVYDKSENSFSKLNAVFSALYSARSSVFVVLRNTREKVEFYIGTKSGDPSNGISVLEQSLAGNFPGCVKNVGSERDVQELSEYIRNGKHNYVGVVTGIPSLRDEGGKEFAQGLEKIIDAMGDEEYVAVLLGTPVLRDELEKIEAGYSNIYSGLSLLDISSFSVSEQCAKTYGKSINESVTESLTKSVGLTVSHTDNQSHTDSSSHTSSKGSSDTAGAYAVVAPMGVGGGVSYSHTWTRNESDTKGASDTKGSADGIARADTTARGLANMKGVGTTESDTVSNGSMTQYAIKNRNVQGWLETLNDQLGRVKEAKNFGAWNWAAYFVAPLERTVGVGTHIYSGLLRGDKSGTERNAVAIWKKGNAQYADIVGAISVFDHPVFQIGDNTRVTPTALIGTSEMAVAMSLPRKSISGVPVFDSVEFGRSVTTYEGVLENGTRKDNDDSPDPSRVRIGKIFHLGKRENLDVELDVNSLTSHMFVTGSTGSGKSNFLYSLLNGLRTSRGAEKGVRFLVIEPAKGEYKSVFGGVRGVSVYGTNPYETELLRVNPFSFPEGVHVMEHIDRLIEILNAVWPMYAAMPAILKDAVETAYRQVGWDLIRSVCGKSKTGMESGNRVFPDFHDLMAVLPEVINSSAYDSEVKSNYSGALVTRIKALTNGYYRTIFQKSELSNETLFDKSCIVDISRVGSSETKSLIMGVLFLKLQEYRMSSCNKPNSGLRHVTVLEEAHNLLRRTSMAQGMETANLAGKSVEMMTNAIAEMRTYGEGFIIADQAPGLLDPAVIRNTNTKVVFRLPDYEDRCLVGKAENLNENQVNELARLPLGCAAVFQNNWQEAVLCQTSKYHGDEMPLVYKPDLKKVVDGRRMAETLRISVLLRASQEGSDLESAYRVLSEEELALVRLYYPKSVQSGVTKGETVKPDKVFYGEILRPIIAMTPKERNIEKWTASFLSTLFATESIAALSSQEKDRLLELTFRAMAENDKEDWQKKIWLENANKVGEWRMW